MATMKCNKCRYWCVEGEPALGLCRRWSPHSNLRWTLTYESDWCGEFMALPKGKSEEDAELRAMAKDLIAYYCKEFEGIYGRLPQILGSDAGAAKNLVKQHGIDRAKWLVSRFLEDPPSYNADNLMLDIRHILTCANKIIARG